jgi:hypothetical protein
MESFEMNASESLQDREASSDLDSFEDTFEIVSDVCVVLNEDQPIFDEYLDEEEHIYFSPCMETYNSFPPIFDEYDPINNIMKTISLCMKTMKKILVQWVKEIRKSYWTS